jgi:nucleoside-diphosphate-sugar epimerase
MKKVSIFGCGWVGKALLQELKHKYKVNCLVKTQASYDALEGKNRFLLSADNLYHEKFYNVDVMLIAIPPHAEYLETLTKLLSFLASSTQFILLSSTSVYSQKEGRVREEDTLNINKPTLMLQAERLLASLRPDMVILRLGGLMGYERIAGKYTAGKTKAHDAPVNYIHRDDVVAIVKLCIERDIRAEVFNVVAPLHPKQSEVYALNAKQFGWENTYFESDEFLGKVVSSEKLVAYFNYQFLKENPLDFWKGSLPCP